MASERDKQKRRPVVLLKDLAPRDDVKGGSRKVVFGDPTQPQTRRLQPWLSTPDSAAKKNRGIGKRSGRDTGK